jgi:hypothetical protein
MKKDDMIVRLLRQIEHDSHAALRLGRIDTLQFKQKIEMERSLMRQKGFTEIEHLYYATTHQGG